MEILLVPNELLRKKANRLINITSEDIKNASKNKIKNELIKRLLLDDKKISSIINSIKRIIKLKDPTNVILEKWKRPNGFFIKLKDALGPVLGIFKKKIIYLP